MLRPDLLTQHRIFDSLPEQVTRAIQEQAEIAPYAPGEVIVSFGQPFTFFGIILSGEAGAYISEEEGNPQRIETFQAGSHIGGMSLMTGLTSPVDVIAVTPCQVLLIPSDLFQRWIQVDPVALQRFSKSVARRSMLIEKTRQEGARRLAEQEADIDPYGLSLISEEPQKILVVNLRTGSLKYRCFDTADETNNVEGQVEWIDQPGTLQTHITTTGKVTFELGQVSHREALQAALSES